MLSKTQKKKLTLAALKTFTFLAYSIGYETVCDALINFGRIQPKLSPRRAEVVKKNFLMIKGDISGWERTFIYFWASTAETLYLPYNTKEEIISKLEHVDNLDVLRWFKSRGKPLIITTAHLGSPEMMANFASALGFPGIAVAEVPSDEWFREFLRFRERFGMKIIPMGNSYPILFEAIMENKFVYLVSDRDIKRKGVAIPLGRGKKYFPTGFARLSVETKTPLVFGYGLPLTPCGKYYGFVSDPYYPKDIYDALEWYAGMLFEGVSRWTDRWFVFQDEWSDENQFSTE